MKLHNPNNFKTFRLYTPNDFNLYNPSNIYDNSYFLRFEATDAKNKYNEYYKTKYIYIYTKKK